MKTHQSHKDSGSNAKRPKSPFFSPHAIFPKLTINQPGDPYEQEADVMAERVMAMPEGDHIQRRCPECKKEEEGIQGEQRLQRQAELASKPAKDMEEEEEALDISRQAEPTSTEAPADEEEEEMEEPVMAKAEGGGMTASPTLQSQLQSSKGSGAPLPARTNRFMSQAFGRDFSHVRVYTGQKASEMNEDIQAKAFTHGSDIYFKNGQYDPNSSAGKKLLAHELTHVVQQNELDKPKLDRSPDTSPDISYRGYHTFYLTRMAGAGRQNGFVAQFTMIDDPSNTVSIKISYQPTRHLRDFQFTIPANKTLNPRLVEENDDSALFDVDGDGIGELEIFLLANENTRGIRVIVTRPGQSLGIYEIPPPRRQIVPNRGYPMGTLPNGKRYYVQPWTSHLPGGPWYVDEDGRRVDPAREFQAAAILDTASWIYLIAFGVIAAIGLGALALEIGGSAATVGALARGASVVRWLFSGTRLVAGGTSAAANLATQALEHGENFSRYNWGSVGFDYVMGAVSYSFAKSVVQRWPAPLFSRNIGNLETWVNFGKQQSVLALYGTIVGAVRALISNTQPGATVGAQHTEGLLQTIKSVALQSFLASPIGRRLFPAGFDDPKIAFLSRTLTFITKLAVREAWDVVPEAQEGQEAQE